MPEVIQERPRSSRQRYRSFVQAYKDRQLDALADGASKEREENTAESQPRPGKRREYFRDALPPRDVARLAD